MFRRRLLLFLVLVLMPLSSCSSGGECDKCDSDDDCNSGFVCRRFSGDESMRCASGEGTTTCRTF
jgi:hypothetical protein